MKLRSLFLLAAILVAASSYSQKKALNQITLDDARRHMKYLSSDALEGRRTGSDGNIRAAEYISSTALEMGIKPLPGRNDLYQPLTYIKVSAIPGESVVTLTDSTGANPQTAELYPLMTPSDNVSFSGEVVFAGYGYTNSEAKYNDFTGVSLNDRIVIIMTRKPDLQGSGMPASDESLSENAEVRKLPMLMLQKAKAIFYVADPALGSDISSSSLSMGSSYQLVPLFKSQSLNFSLNAYSITRQTADMLLRNAGVTLSEMQDSIATSKKPASFIIPGLKADVKINVSRDTVTSFNIVGYIEGSDPKLRNECVIYTAHYDHSGFDSSGRVLNGANDNASGSTGLLAIARAFTSLDKKPPRSILFFWTTGEEEGLHGSTFYAENPLFPLENTIANINFDMIARSRRDTDTGASLNGKIDITGPDTIKVISAGESTAFVALAKESCLKSDLFPVDEGKGSHFSGSDHYPFHRKGVPAIFFFTGIHRDYHQHTDDYEFIDFDKLLKVSKAGFLTGYKLASIHERPVIDNPVKK
ncbi:MAG: M28 family peptidase [Bacteroidales bacterium]|nr:M28 family peptidase [Bacteroidales bacterium]